MQTSPEQEKYQKQKLVKEAIEHRDALLSIASVINTVDGKKLFKYLFKSLDVGQLPDPGMDGKLLYEYLGFLRAGNSIYKLACESSSEIAASILAKIERERYEDLYEQHRIDSGFADTTDSSED